jgi:hypothetical protein
MKDQTASRERGSGSLTRYLPLAGLCFAVLTIAGYLTIGEFPDPETSLADLSTYYAAHGDSVRTGGQLVILGAIFLGIFGLAVWNRVRIAATSPVVAGLMLIGTAIAVTSALGGGGHYVLLGNIGADSTVTPQALQAWHIGSEYGGGGGFLLILGLFAAGVVSRAMPAWLGWSALVLGIGTLTPPPFGFYADLLFLLWAAVAGVVLSVRRVQPSPASGAMPVATAQA